MLEAGFMAADALSVGIPTAANQKKLRSDVHDALTAVGLRDSEPEGTPCCLPFFHAHLLLQHFLQAGHTRAANKHLRR